MLVYLKMGRYRGMVGGNSLELLGWFEKGGDRILTSEEKAEQSQSNAERLAARLRELGENPDKI